jgi:hypothetical protein
VVRGHLASLTPGSHRLESILRPKSPKPKRIWGRFTSSHSFQSGAGKSVMGYWRNSLARGAVGVSLRLSPLILIASAVMTGAVAPPPSSGIESRTMDLANTRATQRLAAPVPANLIGVTWEGNHAAEIELRVRTDEGWSDWLHLTGNPDEGPDPGSAEHNGIVATLPVWEGRGIAELDVRLGEAASLHPKIHLYRSGPRNGGFVSSASAATPQPGILSRADWGADESLRTCDPSYASTVRNAFVHHTVSVNTYSAEEVPAMIRAIYRFHVEANGWCDIGYNFLVDRYGRVWEGRYGGTHRAVIGAHAGGFNTRSTGVAVLGTFQTEAITAATYSILVPFLAWKLSFHRAEGDGTVEVVSGGSTLYPAGTVVILPTIAGHRDVSATSCPGDSFYPVLPRLRGDVQRLIDNTRLVGSPDVSAWGTGRLDVFGRGLDDSLVHKWFDGAWRGWETLGGVLTSNPAAVSWGPGRIDVFARGTDGALWHRWFDGSWSGWESLGGYLTAAPDATPHGPGRLDVFVRGVDGALYQKSWDGAQWTPWANLGGVLDSDPAAAAWSGSRLDVFARGTDQAMWHRWWDGAQWSHWESLGGVLASGPDVTSWGAGRLDVFIRGSDRGVWHRWFADSWSGWESRGCGGCGLLESPAAVAWEPGRLDVFVRSEEALLHQWYSGAWSAWGY